MAPSWVPKRTEPCTEPNDPAIVTILPPGPLVGLRLEIEGPDVLTVKVPEEVAVPTGVVTEIAPEMAAAGTVAVICVALFTVNVVAEMPLNLTAVAPVKFVPVIVTPVPTGPLVGAKLVIVGAAPPELAPFKATITIAQ